MSTVLAERAEASPADRAQPPVNEPRDERPDPAQPGPDGAPAGLEPLRSVHTTSFPAILEELRSSVAVSTYQAGRLVLLRTDKGVLNTHFRCFPKPMGMAVRGGRLAIGTELDICEYHNIPAVARKLDPPEKHDACFLPRTVHATGDVQMHEMAWVPRTPSVSPGNVPPPNSHELGHPDGDEPELWFVNTQFSCLATRHPNYSFVPRWRPWFVKHLTPGDRCHLNGLAVRDGRVKYVTALGETDEPGGWRANKRDGGLLIDIEHNEILVRGLSMPHSPRWYDGKLWLLESGTGSIGTVDLAQGRFEPIAQLPGFTRGLTFAGPLALVGLSQVRESAVFSGIPLVERLQERNCGVWVVNIHTGQTVAFVKFEDALQEIFAVELLPGMRFPDLVNDNRELLAVSFVVPDEALNDVPAQLRGQPA